MTSQHTRDVHIQTLTVAVNMIVPGATLLRTTQNHSSVLSAGLMVFALYVHKEIAKPNFDLK